MLLCVKDMSWDVYGRRLAVMLDRPHPKLGHAALFMTHLTQEPEFMGYVSVVQDIAFSRSKNKAITQFRLTECRAGSLSA